MKKSLIISVLVLSGIFLAEAANAQWQVYRGNGQILTEQVLYKRDQRIFPGHSWSYADVLYTVVGNKIMTGSSGSEFDLVYTCKEGKLYSGRGMYTSEIAYTFENGKVYKGNSTFSLDILYNLKDGVIYAGDRSFSMDAIFVIAGKYSDVDVFAILLSLQLIS